MNKLTISVWILWVMSSFAAGAVNGAEVAFDIAGLILDVPEGWNMSEETPTLSLPNKASVLHFALLQAGDQGLRAARKEARDIWMKDFTVVDSPKFEEGMINGMKAAFFYGGVEGKKLDFYEVYMLTPVSRLLCIYYTVSPDNTEIRDQIRAFIGRIKPKE